MPVDAVTASGSGLDPHISVANARLQAPRVADERGLSVKQGEPSSSTTTRRAARSASSARRRSTCSTSTSRSTSSSKSELVSFRHGPRHAPHLPRCRAGRRQDLRDAQRGSARARARHRRRRRVRRDPRPAEHRRADRRPRGRAAQDDRVPRRRRSRRWTSTRSSPASPSGSLVDELAHTNVPGLAQREALAGRRGAARRRAST